MTVARLLTAEEARVLGCLMEKAVTTPDNYPLSVNALLIACNQTTNRDPIVEYDETTVEHVLESLREKDLRRRVQATGAARRQAPPRRRRGARSSPCPSSRCSACCCCAARRRRAS